MHKVINQINNDLLFKILSVIQDDQLIAIPTETVYGLAANAMSHSAVQKIFVAKNRPFIYPLIVHIGDISILDKWVADIPSVTYRLASMFWPGPMTLIFKKHPSVLDIVTANQDTVAIRIPNHPVSLQILNLCAEHRIFGLACPSANQFTRISPTCVDHVVKELGHSEELKIIVDGGECAVGIESTIIDLTQDRPKIRRYGIGINDEILEKIINSEVVKNDLEMNNNAKKQYVELNQNYASRLYDVRSQCNMQIQNVGSHNIIDLEIQSANIKDARHPQDITAGSHHIHYAPRTNMILVNHIEELYHALSYCDNFYQQQLKHINIKPKQAEFEYCGVFVYHEAIDQSWMAIIEQLEQIYAWKTFKMPNNPQEYAKLLYGTMRKCDELNLDIIVFQMPNLSNNQAMDNRLNNFMPQQTLPDVNISDPVSDPACNLGLDYSHSLVNDDKLDWKPIKEKLLKASSGFLKQDYFIKILKD